MEPRPAHRRPALRPRMLALRGPAASRPALVRAARSALLAAFIAGAAGLGGASLSACGDVRFHAITADTDAAREPVEAGFEPDLDAAGGPSPIGDAGASVDDGGSQRDSGPGVVCPAGATAEREPNGTASTATLLETDVFCGAVSGVEGDGGVTLDVDIYRFTVPATATSFSGVRVACAVPLGTIEATLADSSGPDGSVLSSARMNADDGASSSVLGRDLRPGTYLITLSRIEQRSAGYVVSLPP